MLNHYRSLCICALLALSSCVNNADEDPPSPPQLELGLGSETQLVSGMIGADGGAIDYTRSGDSLSGLELTVSPNTYGEARPFRISYAPITSAAHLDGSLIISPAIIIENSGDYGTRPMFLKIPVNIPDGYFAMPFAYREDGTIEAIPLLDWTPNSVTLWSRHFEHSTIMEQGSRAWSKGRRVQAERPRSTLVVIAEKMDKIMAATVTTSFKPGVDDWQFENRGSHIAPKGHCAGQTFGMMYYFNEQKKIENRPLHNAYDNNGKFATEKIWQDDELAYKFCSVLQDDYRSFFPDIDIDAALAKLGRTSQFVDSLTFMCFKLGIYRTKQPQFIGILRTGGGHAMTIYEGSASELKICDPNYPKKTDRKITFSGPGFQPYTSGPDATTLGVAYPKIRYYGTTATMNWKFAREEWKKFKEGTVGIFEFPTFAILGQDTASWGPYGIASGWKTKTGMAKFTLSTDIALYDLKELYLKDGTTISPNDTGWYQIPDGLNQIGFYVVDIANEWAGFKWIEIEGKNGPTIPRCSREKYWETLLTSGSIVYVDSGAYGRRIILEDLGSPEDICSDEHIFPEWEAWGDVSGLKLEAYTYWSLYGDEKPLAAEGDRYKAKMEIGLRQAFDKDPGYVGLQLRITFPPKGDRATDLAWFSKKKMYCKIRLKYKEHNE